MQIKTGVFIDDTGTPSQKSKSNFDNGDLKTWAAIILSPYDRIALAAYLKSLCEELENELNIKEFHFAHIFSGKGVYRKMSVKKRLGFFYLFGEVYKKINSPILVQTITSDCLIRYKKEYLKHLKINGFDFSNSSDITLWFLLKDCRDYIIKNNMPLYAEFYVDSGRQKPNTIQTVDILKGITEKQELTYSSSEENPMIQFIDFIAFSLNRMRWILMNDKRSESDLAFLHILNNINFNVTNLKKVTIIPNEFNVANYDSIIRKHHIEHNTLSEDMVEEIKKNKG